MDEKVSSQPKNDAQTSFKVFGIEYSGPTWLAAAFILVCALGGLVYLGEKSGSSGDAAASQNTGQVSQNSLADSQDNGVTTEDNGDGPQDNGGAQSSSDAPEGEQ